MAWIGVQLAAPQELCPTIIRVYWVERHNLLTF